jgi:hypothetical protein
VPVPVLNLTWHRQHPNIVNRQQPNIVNRQQPNLVNRHLTALPMPVPTIT